MIHLTPILPIGDTLKSVREETLLMLAESGITVEELREQYEMLYEASTLTAPSIFVPFATDDNGKVYNDITVHFTSTFTVDGDRHVTDGAVLLNYDAAIRVFERTVS